MTHGNDLYSVTHGYKTPVTSAYTDRMAMGHQPVDWQMNKSLVECNRFMFKHQINTDVRFSIENEDCDPTEISAHTYVLISRSPVFNAMLYGSLAAKNTDDAHKIVDVEPEAFTSLLR